MLKKKEKIPITGPIIKGTSCCAVEAIVTVDERGQMVLPRELRLKAGIKAGDKLAVTSWKKDGEICCIALIKAGSMESMVRGLLGPVMKDVL
ncbi:MAG: AbrB/MazE/SpoVT family DNA-binding domain-containing protein [Nitrospirae bacterium]|nr:AbrB/MazE/SpoVT family DNA-binding domain-containing protein [Nitrospirota bacterium]